MHINPSKKRRTPLFVILGAAVAPSAPLFLVSVVLYLCNISRERNSVEPLLQFCLLHAKKTNNVTHEWLFYHLPGGKISRFTKHLNLITRQANNESQFKRRIFVGQQNKEASAGVLILKSIPMQEKWGTDEKLMWKTECPPFFIKEDCQLFMLRLWKDLWSNHFASIPHFPCFHWLEVLGRFRRRTWAKTKWLAAKKRGQQCLLCHISELAAA